MKHKSQLITGACVAALALCAPLTASAKARKSASPSPAASASPAAIATTASPAKKRALPFRGMISAVDQSARTFTINGKGTSRVFKITDATKITKDGNPGTMADLAEKQEIRGSYWKKADGSLEAKSVKLGARTEKEKKSKRKKDAMASPSATP